ncbi:hypothetical protein BJ878DRAFT_81920 [Calycina marina]|uniref:CCHC-type domain-containing protein n=1 Tax=Calycina marina TaxID=1763456 RepID=A0A9P8CEI7_9HELO|nr:hypothetical protein BJ878DRAFT_81920 [Calycina marina]
MPFNYEFYYNAHAAPAYQGSAGQPQRSQGYGRPQSAQISCAPQCSHPPLAYGVNGHLLPYCYNCNRHGHSDTTCFLSNPELLAVHLLEQPDRRGYWEQRVEGHRAHRARVATNRAAQAPRPHSLSYTIQSPPTTHHLAAAIPYGVHQQPSHDTQRYTSQIFNTPAPAPAPVYTTQGFVHQCYGAQRTFNQYGHLKETREEYATRHARMDAERSERRRRPLVCYNCHEVGHFAKDCDRETGAGMS